MNKAITTLSVFVVGLVCAGSAHAAIGVNGNGFGSHNKVKSYSSTSGLLVQSNKAVFKNNLGVDSSSGNVKANKNTNSDVTVLLGNSSTTADVTNTANVNAAVETVEACCPCAQADADITISDNGAFSWNSVKTVNKCSSTTIQNNDAYIKNNIGAGSSTGGVSASQNTGGSVDVTTGDSTTTVTVVNTANSNSVGGAL